MLTGSLRLYQGQRDVPASRDPTWPRPPLSAAGFPRSAAVGLCVCRRVSRSAAVGLCVCRRVSRSRLLLRFLRDGLSSLSVSLSADVFPAPPLSVSLLHGRRFREVAHDRCEFPPSHEVAHDIELRMLRCDFPSATSASRLAHDKCNQMKRNEMNI